jgi:hypothetical protein
VGNLLNHLLHYFGQLLQSSVWVQVLDRMGNGLPLPNAHEIFDVAHYADEELLFLFVLALNNVGYTVCLRRFLS